MFRTRTKTYPRPHWKAIWKNTSWQSGLRWYRVPAAKFSQNLAFVLSSAVKEEAATVKGWRRPVGCYRSQTSSWGGPLLPWCSTLLHLYLSHYRMFLQKQKEKDTVREREMWTKGCNAAPVEKKINQGYIKLMAPAQNVYMGFRPSLNIMSACLRVPFQSDPFVAISLFPLSGPDCHDTDIYPHPIFPFFSYTSFFSLPSFSHLSFSCPHIPLAVSSPFPCKRNMKRSPCLIRIARHTLVVQTTSLCHSFPPVWASPGEPQPLWCCGHTSNINTYPCIEDANSFTCIESKVFAPLGHSVKIWLMLNEAYCSRRRERTGQQAWMFASLLMFDLVWVCVLCFPCWVSGCEIHLLQLRWRQTQYSRAQTDGDRKGRKARLWRRTEVTH